MSEWPEALIERLALHLWDEGIIRPESLGREAVVATLDALGLREYRRVGELAGNDTPVKAREGTFVRFVTPWEDV